MDVGLFGHDVYFPKDGITVRKCAHLCARNRFTPWDSRRPGLKHCNVSKDQSFGVAETPAFCINMFLVPSPKPHATGPGQSACANPWMVRNREKSRVNSELLRELRKLVDADNCVCHFAKILSTFVTLLLCSPWCSSCSHAFLFQLDANFFQDLKQISCLGGIEVQWQEKQKQRSRPKPSEFKKKYKSTRIMDTRVRCVAIAKESALAFQVKN